MSFYVTIYRETKVAVDSALVQQILTPRRLATGREVTALRHVLLPIQP